MSGKFISKKRSGNRGGGLASNISVLNTTAPETASQHAESRRSPSVSSDNLDDPSGGFCPPKKKRKVVNKPLAKTKERKSATLPDKFEATIEWPQHFVKLEKIFKALNTVYTFLSARRHMSSTYENLKSSVESLLKAPLEIHDIAQLKSLMPTLIKFAYVDPSLLQVHADGHGDEKGKGKQRDHYEDFATEKPAPKPTGEQQVLLFQFNDGELKGKGGKAIGKKANNKKFKGKKDVEKMATTPTFAPNAMSDMIEKRNFKFREAVDELLLSCSHSSEDPVKLLLDATEEHIPVRHQDDDLKPLKERKEDLDFFLRNPHIRPSITSIIDDFVAAEDYKNQIVQDGHISVEAREATYGDLQNSLSPKIMDALYETKRITQLYAHQAEAINHLAEGHNVIVSTSTSSGKSLIYQLPALSAFEKDSSATAIYIYPTKALAQDQKRALSDLLAACDHLDFVKIATYDGDTPKEDRDYIRANANVIFTNPDMLHISILPQEEQWRRMFTNLKLVVVDELHMYNGLFGSHVALIMRRLRRICRAVGNETVQFVSCSATVANPLQHMEAVFGITDVKLVDIDGSPSGAKEWLVWNPPLIDPKDVRQGRVSSINEASRVFRFLMDHGIRTIIFCRVRKLCELMMKQVRTDLMLEGREDIASRVMSYRSGYSPQDRRQIEKDMFSGQLLGIIATTALELGIDIGSLDAVISLGFPYTLSGLRQQAGRAGRRNKDSLAMLICDPFPVDQHYAKCPGEIFSNPYDAISIDIDNPLVLEGHLQCAAAELPLRKDDDAEFFGYRLSQICDEKLVKDDDGFYHCHYRFRPFPSKQVAIRNTEDERYSVVDTTNGRYHVMEEIEWSRAIFELYEGAIFMHQGDSYLVREINHETKIGKLERTNVEWTTKQRDFTDVDAIETLRMRELRNALNPACYGKVKITSIVFGYFKVDRKLNILDVVDVDTPPFIRESHGVWLDVSSTCIDILRAKNIHMAGAIHAAQHVLLSQVSSAGDVRTDCKPAEKEFTAKKSLRKRPARLIIYDANGKSGGVCAKAFDHIHILLNSAADRVISCPCQDGCPRCIASSMCSEANIVSSKIGARVVLESLLGREIDVDAIPMQEAMSGVTPSDTIVVVQPVKHRGDTEVVNVAGERAGTIEERHRPAVEPGGFLQGF